MDAPGAAERRPAARRRHRTLVSVLLVVATISGLLAVFALWVNRQVFNTHNWTQTSSNMLADPKIQTAVGNYMTDELFRNVDVAASIRSALPPQAQAAAAPAAAGLQQLAQQAAPKVLARPRVQDAWRKSNEVAHAQLMQILNGGGSRISTNNGEVTLDLRALVDQLAASAGVTSQVNAARQKVQGSSGAKARQTVQQKTGIKLPPNAGQIVILKSNQLKAAQDVAEAGKGLSIGLTALSLALFALAVWLAQGWRRTALRTTGWCFLGLGLAVLLARRVGGNMVVESLVPNASTRPAAHDAWAIGTSLLYDIAVAMVLYGLVFIVAAWLAGTTRPAVAVRRAMAPAMRHHPVRVYGVVALLFALVLLWGPTPATTKLWGIVLFVVLIILGVEVLRRQIGREFPDAQPGDTMRRIGARSSARRRERRVESQAAAAPVEELERLDRLERLGGLHDRGVLDDDEFRAQKALLLDGAAR
jgi:hypothetical protein